MQIYEIYRAINGLGLRQGTISTYIRTFTCNLGCTSCDTAYCADPESDETLNGYTVMSVEDIMDEVADYGNRLVTICGGEPLLQRDLPELVAALLDAGYLVNIETQGGIALKDFEANVVDILADDSYLNNLQYVLDYKCPSTNVADKMVEANINFLIDSDSLLFTVNSEEDLLFMVETLEEFEPPATVFVRGKAISDKDILDFLFANSLHDVRLCRELILE